MDNDEMADGVWEFYDSWAAFPGQQEKDHPSVVGNFNIGLSCPDGGTYGEFGITFYEFDRLSARLEVFTDGMKALVRSDLTDRLAAMDEASQGPDEIRALLINMGMRDKTADLRGDRPVYCRTCRGRGVLDDVAPSDRVDNRSSTDITTRSHTPTRERNQ